MDNTATKRGWTIATGLYTIGGVAAGSLNAIHVGHLDVHDHDVWTKFPGEVDCALAVARFTHH